MPDALVTTKRKFYRLLDNLTPGAVDTIPRPKRPFSEVVIPTQATRVRSDGSSEPPSKRSRTSASTESSFSFPSKDSLAERIAKRAQAIREKDSRSSLRSVDAKELPYFSPWSQQTFLKRLKTFASVTAWYPKPALIAEVHWVSRGWECCGNNTVWCRGGCGKRVVVNMDRTARQLGKSADEASADGQQIAEQVGDHDLEDGDADDEDFETRLAERYQTMLIEGHAPNCLWRKAACKDDIYRLPIVKTAVWQQALRESYQSLQKLGPEIAKLKLADSFNDEPDTKLCPPAEKILADLPDTLLHPTVAADSIPTHPATDTAPLPAAPNVDALRIALHGWRGATEASTPLLTCQACFQRIGLWMYQPAYKARTYDSSAADDNRSSDAAAADDDSDSKQQVLDLVEMHREHCPWRNAASQCATSGDYAGLPAWRIFWRVVSRYADEQRRRSRGSTVFSRNDLGADREVSVELSREEVQALDKARVNKIARLKKVLGFGARPKGVAS